ncbi:hypothetical protein N7468_000689 [Penicillium chermesinum]|uniref:Uncharacterized protein n=1 Tax=Penicillium chermesinum TaxID=63820 RepID=A0A9W9PKQ4_9EURO|nr:uncharacterized protein N7468_000689 [Penicillium chermesinum]KAJ5249238.1 hypothetical protein N7468_000689 [Penicillium chermesinum]KAJ6151329.1 hypothetical protein N7470_007923 [Penicillium chermesinum]
MSGSAGDTAHTDEASEELETSMAQPDTYAERISQSASGVRERIAKRFEPGENKTTTRRYSDTPILEPMDRPIQDNFSGEDFDDQTEPPENSPMAKAHEVVAKALGGGGQDAS